jgi:hypothetical protein
MNKPNTPATGARTHPEDRARIAALNHASQALRGAPAEKLPTSYYTPELIQCTLPHSDPRSPHWIRRNGNYSLIVASGIDREGVSFGVPYGSFPRLVLAYIITRVVETKERRIDFSSYFSGFLKEIGYTGNHKGNSVSGKRIHDQLERLLHATISFEYKDDEQRSRLNITVAPKSVLWWNYKKPDQGSLWASYIDISEDFYTAILNAPVPLRTDILASLKKSPLALDVYMWISYRLFTMHSNQQEQITLSYGRLQEQFGTGISEANYRSFRRDFKAALAKVADQWVSPEGKELLNYELHEDGLTLFRSPLLINIAKPKSGQSAAEEEAARIITAKKFDDITLKQARQIAGDWDVKYLQEQYFAWVQRKGVTPKDAKKHFFAFIKRHRQRNEKKLQGVHK